MKGTISKIARMVRGDTTHAGNVTPSRQFVEMAAHLVERSIGPIRIAEIGVDKGASTREVAKLLREGDVFDLYDRESCDLFSNLDSVLANCRGEVTIHANSTRLMDSYAWHLAKQLTQMLREEKDTAIWDLVYLDGAHTFPVDAPATCCLKEMIKVGGHLVFDDMDWSYSVSPTLSKNAEALKRFTDEQNSEPHVSLVVDAFVRSDARYEEISEPKACRSIFRRIT
jgi:hypothetical protein